MLGLLLGGPFRLLGAGGGMCCGIIAVIAAVTAVCGCMRCMRCKIRDCALVKRVLRWSGQDQFADFDLMVLVHEATFDKKGAKMMTVVRVTAGAHAVMTDPNSSSNFQQPLHITVEQGTEAVIVDLNEPSTNRVLATLSLDVDTLRSHNKPETVFSMKQKSKGIHNPFVKLTIVVSTGAEDDDQEEAGLISNAREMSADVDILVKQQLMKSRRVTKAAIMEEGRAENEMSEMEVLKQACAGPLELFEGLGLTNTFYVAVLGPPISRRWVLGIWRDQHDFETKKSAMQVVDLLKVQSVQVDPSRHHVFVIECFDESRVLKTLTFRRIDRARDVWVELLHILVVKAREARDAAKSERRSSSASGIMRRTTKRNSDERPHRKTLW